MPSTARERSITSLSLALPASERCERPSAALARPSNVHPGRLAQGPEEKQGLFGRVAGLDVIIAAQKTGILARRQTIYYHRICEKKSQERRLGQTPPTAVESSSCVRGGRAPAELQCGGARAQSHTRRHQPADEVAGNPSRRAAVPPPQPAARIDRRGCCFPAGRAQRARWPRGECRPPVGGIAPGPAGD